MTRLLTICLLSLFTLGSSGLSLQLHFCCGKLKSVEVNTHKECCDGNKVSDCCIVSPATLPGSVKAEAVKVVVQPALIPPVAEVRTAIAYTGADLFYAVPEPPPLSSVPIYLMNRVFRI